MKLKKDMPAQLLFSKRQLMVLQTWSAEPDSKRAAALLGITEYTLIAHLRQMRQRLQVKRTHDVYRYAIENGLI